jgi:hypothetical protein
MPAFTRSMRAMLSMLSMLSPLFLFFLDKILTMYLYVRSFIYPLSQEQKQFKTVKLQTRPFSFADATQGVYYTYAKETYIAMKADDVKADGLLCPITTVLIKDGQNQTVTNPRLDAIFKKMGGYTGDFHRRSFGLDKIRELFGDLPGHIARVICTNDNYDEFIFKNKED